MQLLHTVTLVLCISTVLSFKPDVRQTSDASTNEVDNSVIGRAPENNLNQDDSNAYGLKTYGGPGGYIRTDQVQNTDMVAIPSTIAPQPEEVQPMPTTGCFGHLPEENGINNNNIENIAQPSRQLPDPMPQQFNPQNQGFGPQTEPFYPPHQRYFPHHFPNHHHHHHHHPHFPHYSQNPWGPWRRNMQYVGPQQFYPQNPWSPWRRQMPFVMPPTAPQFGPQGGNRPPLVIVKLLQPIILPVAKPFYPEGGDQDPDSEEVDTQKFTTGGFQKYLNGRPHRMSLRRFGGERMRSFEDTTNGQNTYGPYKIHGENVHVSIKLH